MTATSPCLPAQPVLVTGATGFIGRRVVHRLLAEEIAVRALVLPEETIPRQWGEAVTIIRGSLSDEAAVQAAVAGAQTIIHLAAVVSDWGDENRYWELTVAGSRRVFEQAVMEQARVVLASSIVVYGHNIGQRRCHEALDYGRTFGPYSRTKQAQEKLAWDFHRSQKMRLTVIRPANVYGPASGPWLLDVLPQLHSRGPALVGRGNGNAGLIYVDNVADVLVLAGAVPAAEGRVYNACDGLAVTWRQYLTDLAHLVGARPPGSLPRPLARLVARSGETIWKLLQIQQRPPLTREALNLVGSDNRIAIDRLQAELGYVPRVSYEAGMAQVRRYLADQRKERVS